MLGGKKRSSYGEGCIRVYPGQYYDSETGLHYNWNRYYEPWTGRYVTEDPIGLGVGINIFIYVKNNPLKFIDQFGLCPKGTHAANPTEIAKIIDAANDIIDKSKHIYNENKTIIDKDIIPFYQNRFIDIQNLKNNNSKFVNTLAKLNGSLNIENNNSSFEEYEFIIVDEDD